MVAHTTKPTTPLPAYPIHPTLTQGQYPVKPQENKNTPKFIPAPQLTLTQKLVTIHEPEITPHPTLPHVTNN